jgi:hypothetical protein
VELLVPPLLEPLPPDDPQAARATAPTQRRHSNPAHLALRPIVDAVRLPLPFIGLLRVTAV